jgi:hypothetical protein
MNKAQIIPQSTRRPIHPAGTWSHFDPMPAAAPAPSAVFPEATRETAIRYVSWSGPDPVWVTDGGLAIQRQALATVSRALSGYATRRAAACLARQIPFAGLSPYLATAGSHGPAAVLSGVAGLYAIATATTDGRQSAFNPAKAATLAALLVKRPGLRLTMANESSGYAKPGTLRVWDEDGQCVAILMSIALVAPAAVV